MKILFAKYEFERRPECRIETLIAEADGRRVRTVRALSAAAHPHIARLAAQHALLSEALVPEGPIALPSLISVRKDHVVWEDVPGPTLADRIASNLLDRDADELAARLAAYRQMLIEGFKTAPDFIQSAPETDFFHGLDISALACGPAFTNITCADAIPDKLVFHGGRHWLVAPEWVFGHGYPVAFVLTRGIRCALIANPSEARPADSERIRSALIRLGIKPDEIDTFSRMDAHLDSWIRTGEESAPNQRIATI